MVPDFEGAQEGCKVEKQQSSENTGGENQRSGDQDRPRTAAENEVLRRSKFNEELSQPRTSNDLAIQNRFEFGLRNHLLLDDINKWLKFPEVEPRDAALVLCMQDAIADDGKEPVKFIIGVVSRDFKWMLKAFQGLAEHEKRCGIVQARTLLDWRDLARDRELNYHSWLDNTDRCTQ